ncbi:MAG: hypothetical protein HGB17_12225, partial [Syntrophobacteraceae bacterium]|nr:hypothetical protein [Syntrophobacteraceae bacterium]
MKQGRNGICRRQQHAERPRPKSIGQTICRLGPPGSHSKSPPTSRMSSSSRCNVDAIVISRTGAASSPPRINRPYVPRRRVEDRIRQVPVGPELLGRVLDSSGRTLDRKGPLTAAQRAPLYSRALNPMEREPIRDVLDVGVRAINALLTVGRGQRMGLFSGSGVGKSMLLGMMARYTSADVVVVG